MNKKIKTLLLLAAIMIISLPLFSENFLATTLWVKGIAELAGIENLKTFAPPNMKHPPEYELTPQDILELSKADVVFIAGYEKKMVEKINESFNSSGKKFRIIKIKTENSLENLKTEALKIASEFGKEKKCRSNIAELEKIFIDFKKYLSEKKAENKNFYIHSFQLPLAESFGLNISGSFGPAQITSKELGEISKLKNTVIIDNIHNPVGISLTEANKKAVYAAFLNFPGMFDTITIKDVILYNKKQIENILK